MMNEEMLSKYMRFTDKDVLIDKKFYETYLIPSFANAIRYKRLYEQSEQRITRAIEYIGNKNIGISRKTREKAIKILRGVDDE